MDDETRFWIAQEVGDTKYKHDAGNLFRKGKEAIGRVPTTLITDGLVSYHEAYKRVLYDKDTESRTYQYSKDKRKYEQQ